MNSMRRSRICSSFFHTYLGWLRKQARNRPDVDVTALWRYVGRKVAETANKIYQRDELNETIKNLPFFFFRTFVWLMWYLQVSLDCQAVGLQGALANGVAAMSLALVAFVTAINTINSVATAPPLPSSATAAWQGGY